MGQVSEYSILNIGIIWTIDFSIYGLGRENLHLSRRTPTPYKIKVY